MSDKKIIYFLLCCGCVTISFNVSALTAALPSISLDMGVSNLAASHLVRYYMLPYGLGALFYAPLTRFVNYRRIMAVSMAVYAVSSLYCAFAANLWQMIAARVMMGFSGAGAIPLGLILIGQLFEKHVRGRLVGLFFSCSFFASIAGIVTLGVKSWHWLFMVPALIGGLTALGFALVRSQELRRVRGVKVDYLKALGQVRIRNVFIFIFVISFLFHGVRNWFGVYLGQVYQMDKLMISTFYVVIAFCGALGQNLGGWISDKRGRYAASWLGVILLSTATIGLSLKLPAMVLLAVMAAVQTGWTVGHNGVLTALTDFPDEHRPEIASLNWAVRFGAGGVGLWLSTPFVERSFEGTFLVTGILMLMTVFCLKFIIPRKGSV